MANDRAIAADRVYLANEGAMNFHTLSRIHNLHLKIYACLFLGQFNPALAAAEEIIATTPEALLRIENPAMADWMEAYIGMKAHVFIRFGKWQELVDHPLPEDSDLYLMTTTVWHYAKTIAHAALDDVEAAEQQRTLFLQRPRAFPKPAMCSTIPASMSSKSPSKCCSVKSSTASRITTLLMTTCARRFTSTTISSTTNPGAGCNRHGTHSVH